MDTLKDYNLQFQKHSLILNVQTIWGIFCMYTDTFT